MRSRLAKLLAKRSDTLIMLSATPHDGRARSFASLMNMLDPTAITDPNGYVAEDVRAQGQFDRIVLASMNANLAPLKRSIDSARDRAGRAAAETMERALVHVAASRAKKELLVLSHGSPSPLLGGQA